MDGWIDRCNISWMIGLFRHLFQTRTKQWSVSNGGWYRSETLWDLDTPVLNTSYVKFILDGDWCVCCHLKSMFQLASGAFQDVLICLDGKSGQPLPFAGTRKRSFQRHFWETESTTAWCLMRSCLIAGRTWNAWHGPMKSYGSSSGAPGTIEEYGCP